MYLIMKHLLNIKSNSLNGECIIATDNFRLNSLAGEGYDGVMFK